MEKVKVHNKEFKKFIDKSDIEAEIKRVAAEISADYKYKSPLFISVLNGSFMFTSDLLKELNMADAELSFIKINSYSGTESTNKINKLIGLNQSVKDRHIVILEDMIDSGNSIKYLIESLKKENPASISVAAMFFKPEALQTGTPPKYFAMSIGNEFVIGRGLDYDGLGRCFPDLYVIC